MFIASGFSNIKHKFLPSFDVLWMTGTELYIAPWTRITPYIVGVACGYFLNKNRKTFTASDVRQIPENWPWQRETDYSLFLLLFHFKIQQRLQNFLFSISTFLMLLALHCTIYRDMGTTLASVFIIIGRPLIAIGVSIFIIMNGCGYDCE